MGFAVFTRYNADSANYPILKAARDHIDKIASEGLYHAVLNTAHWRRDRYNWVVAKLIEDGYEVVTHPFNHRIIVSWDSHSMSRWEKIKSMFVRMGNFL